MLSKKKLSPPSKLVVFDFFLKKIQIKILIFVLWHNQLAMS